MRLRIRTSCLQISGFLIAFCFVHLFNQLRHLANIPYPDEAAGPCRVPHLELWLPELQGSSPPKDLDCNLNGLRFTIEKARGFVKLDDLLPHAAWLEQGSLHLRPDTNAFQCDAFPIHRLDEYRSVYGDPLLDVKSGYRPSSPHFMLLCQPKTNLLASGNFSWIPDFLITQRRFYFCGSRSFNSRQRQAGNHSSPNVLLLGIDSLSRLSWQRYLPRTLSKLNEYVLQKRASIFNLYHVVGDGTTSNLLALLTGHFEDELPESRRFVSKLLKDNKGLLDSPVSSEKEYKGENRTPVDDFPWIWKEFDEKGGYATHYIEDTPNWGTFQYRLRGFGGHGTPVHSYGRPCVVAAAQDEARYGKQMGCIGSRQTHKVLLESLREFFYANKDRPRFSLTFLSEMVHEEPSKAALLDADVAGLLKQVDLDDEGSVGGVGEFANTIVVLFSDHGSRMGKARLSFQGKLEERLPMLAMVFPRRFADSWPNIMSTIQANADRLCSPFDLHATLQHLLTSPYATSTQRKRGQTLLSPLSSNRTCGEAGVASYWCACTNWVAVQRGLTGDWSREVKEGARVIVDTINSATRVLIAKDLKMTKHGRKVTKLVGACEELCLREIISADFSTVSEDVLRFKGTADRDGRIAEFSDSSAGVPHVHAALRLHLLLEPGNAHFEVMLHAESGGAIGFQKPKLEDIRRLDAYEKHAKCLEPRMWSRARQLCICK